MATKRPQDRLDVVAGRHLRDAEVPSDHLCGEPSSEKLEYVALAGRQADVGSADLAAVGRAIAEYMENDWLRTIEVDGHRRCRDELAPSSRPDEDETARHGPALACQSGSRASRMADECACFVDSAQDVPARLSERIRGRYARQPLGFRVPEHDRHVLRGCEESVAGPEPLGHTACTLTAAAARGLVGAADRRCGKVRVLDGG